LSTSGGGTIAGGRVLDFTGKETGNSAGHLSLLDRMEVTEEEFDDAETRLDGLA
jgi:hypothetical protein